MTNLNPPPYPPYQRPMSLDVPQAPAHVWAQLSPAQQQQVYQTLAQVCRQLVHQIKSREQPHDHR
jgi:hypothetical protein